MLNFSSPQSNHAGAALDLDDSAPTPVQSLTDAALDRLSDAYARSLLMPAEPFYLDLINWNYLRSSASRRSQCLSYLSRRYGAPTEQVLYRIVEVLCFYTVPHTV